MAREGRGAGVNCGFAMSFRYKNMFQATIGYLTEQAEKLCGYNAKKVKSFPNHKNTKSCRTEPTQNGNQPAGSKSFKLCQYWSPLPLWRSPRARPSGRGVWDVRMGPIPRGPGRAVPPSALPRSNGGGGGAGGGSRAIVT